MTNTTLSQALAIALTLTDEDKATLTQMLVALGSARVSAPSTLVEQTESAPTRKERNTTRKECVDTDVHFESLGKGFFDVYTLGADGERKGVASATKKALKDVVLKADGYTLTWDKAYERAEVYKRETVHADGSVSHVGDHKRGAWTLVKGDKRVSAQTTSAWLKRNAVVSVSGEQAQAFEDKRVERNIRKNERDAKRG